MRLVLVLLISLVLGCQGCSLENDITRQAGLVVADGIWYQYTCPVAVQANDKTFWGWIDTLGDVWVASYDHDTGKKETFRLYQGLNIDDHSNPALHVRQSDGRIIAFYTKHNDPVLRWRISTSPYDISSFGDEKTYTQSGDPQRNICYPQPIELSSEGRIYVFFRAVVYGETPVSLDRDWHFIISTDNGETFGNETTLRVNFQSYPEENPYIINPYTIPVSDDISRIHFVSFDYEQIAKGGTPKNIYHWYYEDGAYYNSDGTRIKDLTDGHIESIDDVTVVHEVDDVNIWDIALDENGYPVIVYVKFEDYDTDHRYRYARWNGSQWNHYEIVSGGSCLPEAEGREWYSGGICLNSADPSIVYVSIEISPGIFEICEYATHDGGETWQLVEKYEGEPNTKNFRPQYPRKADEDYVKLMFISGDYIDLNDYETSIFRIPGS